MPSNIMDLASPYNLLVNNEACSFSYTENYQTMTPVY